MKVNLHVPKGAKPKIDDVLDSALAGRTGVERRIVEVRDRNADVAGEVDFTGLERANAADLLHRIGEAVYLGLGREVAVVLKGLGFEDLTWERGAYTGLAG